MTEYLHAKALRVAQFEGYLKLMYRRAHVEGAGSSFIIFSESPGGETSGGNQLKSARRKVIAGSSGGRPPHSFDDPTAGEAEGQEPEPCSRHLQFCYERHWFAMDLPNDTIFLPESVRLVRERRGFFREVEVATAGVSELEDLLTFDPMCKKYLYGEEREAAEDMAYVFYEIYRLFIDTPLYVSASPFSGDESWEDNFALPSPFENEAAGGT